MITHSPLNTYINNGKAVETISKTNAFIFSNKLQT